MKKFFFTSACCLVLLSSAFANDITIIEIEIEDTVLTAAEADVFSDDSDACRATCTISVNGIGISATAGGIFTSCSRAAEKACQKVRDLAQDMVEEL